MRPDISGIHISSFVVFILNLRNLYMSIGSQYSIYIFLKLTYCPHVSSQDTFRMAERAPK